MNKKLEKYLSIIILIPAFLLIIYALPYSFTIPTTRISLPFTNNTAEATSIVLISSFFIATFYSLCNHPLFWRTSTTVALSEIGFVFFEAIHGLNLHSFRIGHTLENDFSFLFKNVMITIGILMVLWLINLYGQTLQVTSSISIGMLIFIGMTILQISRDWYNHPFDGPYTVAYKAVGIWMWGALVKRDPKL